MNVIDQAHSIRPRLEHLLEAQCALRKHEKDNRHWLWEIERAIEELQGGWPNSHTDTVERFATALLNGATA